MIKRLVAPYRILIRRSVATVLAGSAVVCVLAFLACRGDSSPTNEWDGVVRDSAGVQIVENFGMPLWPGGPGWEFTEVLRIGALDGPPEYQFGNITGIQVLSDGRIVIVYIVRCQPPMRMCCIVSEDEGKTWSEEIVLRDDSPPVSNQDGGYPVAVELKDGRIFAAYYWQVQEDDIGWPGGRMHIAGTFFELK